MTMTVNYKKLARKLKAHHEAATRLLVTMDAFKILNLEDDKNGVVASDVVKLLDTHITEQCNASKHGVRLIHLTRAYIKGLPYKQVEQSTKTPISMHDEEWICDLLIDLCCLPDPCFENFTHTKFKSFTTTLRAELEDWFNLPGFTTELFARKAKS